MCGNICNIELTEDTAHMKKIVAAAMVGISVFFGSIVVDLGVPEVEAAVSVKGYFKKNGTYVAPHMRSNPDSSLYNNYSFPGNTNPYTGKTATGDPDTYIKNLYDIDIPSYTPPTYSWPTYTSPSATTTACSANSYEYNGGCYCNVGYKPDSDGICTWSGDAATFQSCSSGYCYCSVGQIIKGGRCVKKGSSKKSAATSSRLKPVLTVDCELDRRGACTCPKGYNQVVNKCVLYK